MKFRVPELLMDCKKEPALAVINRFNWVDNKTIRIISHDGIEKIVHIENKFKEVEFNRIPDFDPDSLKHCHFMYDLPSPKINDTLSRLRRKYQNYKSAYCFRNKENDKKYLEKGGEEYLKQKI